MAAFTTIAAGVGLAATVGSTAMSFAQAGKQKALEKKAKQSAGIAMEEAKRALQTNYYASQAIKKEPYELQREALLSQGAKAIEAGIESEKGAAPIAGMIQMSMQEGQAALTNAMRQEMTDLENKTLAEESRLRDIGVQLNLGEVEGAQLAARDAAEAQARATQQGMQGVTSAAGQAASFVPLFSKGTPDMSFMVTDPANPYDIKNPQPAVQQSYGFGGKNYIPPQSPFMETQSSLNYPPAPFGPQPQPQNFNPFMFTKY
jgi:hypothetical protein